MSGGPDTWFCPSSPPSAPHQKAASGTLNKLSLARRAVAMRVPWFISGFRFLRTLNLAGVVAALTAPTCLSMELPLCRTGMLLASEPPAHFASPKTFLLLRHESTQIISQEIYEATNERRGQAVGGAFPGSLGAVGRRAVAGRGRPAVPNRGLRGGQSR